MLRPAAPPPPRGGRCAGCRGELYRTRATGQPQQEDHKPGCEFFVSAVKVMRYAKELMRATRGHRGIFGSNRRQRYLREGAKELFAAACESNPVHAVERLEMEYAAECEKGTKQAKAAEILMKACQALVQGKDPAPIIPGPE